MNSTTNNFTDGSPSSSNHFANENYSNLAISKSSNATTPSYHSTRLPPLGEILNYAEPAVQPVVNNSRNDSQLLGNAIDAVQEEVFRMMIKGYCESIPELKKALESRLLVRGKDIVRYHDGAESEAEGDDASEKDIDEEESGDEDDESDKESREETGHSDRKEIKPIVILDEQVVPRFAKCLNCQETFDLADNERGYCSWHTGEKEVNDEHDIWADHDEDCHGRIWDLQDEPGFAEGFQWSCCQREGDDEGCKHTKHKAAENTIVKQPHAATTYKRKAEEELSRPEKLSFMRG